MLDNALWAKTADTYQSMFLDFLFLEIVGIKKLGKTSEQFLFRIKCGKCIFNVFEVVISNFKAIF